MGRSLITIMKISVDRNRGYYFQSERMKHSDSSSLVIRELELFFETASPGDIFVTHIEVAVG
jgi:hypothetical protein